MSHDVNDSDDARLTRALARVGEHEAARDAIFSALREAEAGADDPALFRETVRWPVVRALLTHVRSHRITLKSGLIFEIGLDSRIERALLLSAEAHPDHVWEPQTTKLLTMLAAGAAHVIVGGAYIGDHVLPIARELAATNPQGVVHAFEPMGETYRRLLRNLELNAITNVIAHRLGLWDASDITLNVEGLPALASSLTLEETREDSGENVRATSIDDYVRVHGLESVGLIMLDTEGGEEKALRGARGLLARPSPEAPHLVFEVHRNYVDWTGGLENTSIVTLLTSNGYTVFAIRDFHDNYPMTDKVIEIIPVDSVYLEGPPHGFNLMATKAPDAVERLGLRVVRNVSPKLLRDKDPALHHPLDGLPTIGRTSA